MQSRLDSPNFNATPRPDQRLMDRAREAAIRVRKEEQETIVQSRKRKLKDLYQVTRQIEFHRPISGSGGFVFGAGGDENGVDDYERKFLELNDMLLGRFYDESSLPRLFAATITPSVALKHSVSPTLSRKLPIQHSPRALLKSPTLSQARSVEVRSDAKQTPASISESNIPAEACLVRTPLGVDKGVSTATEDVTSASPNPARKESPVSPKRRKVARPTASPVTQGEMLEIPPPTASTAPAPHTASDFYRGDTAPIVSVYGVPVIQNARAPIVSETRKEASSDNVESEGEQAVLPPPPPLSLVHNDLDKKICPANGDPASIEDNIRTSLAKLSKPEQASAALATPSTSNEAPFPIVHTQKRSPTASQPQLAVVLPVLPSIRKLSPPVSSQSLQDRQNTPSSPITSDEDDDDRENNGAIISSATSPDVSLLLLEDSRSEIRSAEAIEKKDPIARIGDPSAQLRLEDELARKDHEESEVQDLKTTHHATEGLVNREDVDVVMEEKLGKEQEEVPTGQLDASEKIAVDEQNEEPISEVPVPISKVSPREDRVVEQALVGRQHEEPSQSIAVPSPDGSVPENMEARLSPANKVMEILPVLPPFTAKSPDIEAEEPVIASVAEKLPTLQEAPSQASENLKPANDADILSEVIEDKQDLEKSKTAEIVGPTLPSDRPNAPAACKSIVLSESAQRDTAENLDMETSPDRMDVDDTRATTIKKTATPHENNALTKHELEKVGQPRALRDRHINAEESDNISEDILVEPVEEGPAITVAAEVPRKTSPSFAVLKVLEQRRRKEQERLRLKKVVFVGDSAEEKLNSHGALKASTIPQGVNNAKFSQDVANFLSYSTKKRADPESIDLIHQPHVQVTRQRSSSITLAHGPSYQKKDYLTPYFQLEAFEHPLQDLLQKSHKTLLTSNHQLSIQEQQTKKVYRRIQQLQDKGLWSLRQPVRVREPRRRLCHWDYLLQEAHWMSIDFKQERRLKIAQCKQIADMVMQWHNAQPEERPFLCMNRQEWSKRMGVKGRKLLPQDMLAVAEEGHHETIIPNDNDTEDQEMENSLKTPKPEPISKYYMEIAQSPEPSRLLRNESLAEMGVKTECDIGDQYENEEADMFTHLGNPPAQLFTLGPGETVFEMPLTDSANEILSQLPIFAPPTLPIDPSILDNQFEENWQMPIIPVSKLCVAIMKFKEEGPPRKRSRYEYEENYNLFADDSDAEDLLPGDIQNGSFAGNPEKSMSQTQPVPLPPESTNVALFNPSFKHILNRMRQGHNFKPPAFPPVAFFENRQPSHWLPSEDEKLKDLVQRYPQNWSLISTFMTFKGDLHSTSERRSPWECFERYLQIENSVDFAKSPYYKGIQQRIEISSKINVPSNVSATAQNGTGGSGSSTPTIRRRGNNPVRVERRKNTKFVSLFDSMRKLAKRREVTMTKQQNAAGIANRKAELQSQTKPKLQNFVPAYFSKMKYERELKQEKLAQEKAALLAQQRAGQTHRAHPAQPHAFANGIPMQHHPAQVRNGAPGVNSPVVNTSNSNGLPPGTAGIPVHRASPSVPHTLPNGIVPVSSGAPVPGMNGIPHNSVQGVPQVNGAAAANIPMGLRQHSAAPGLMRPTNLTPEQVQQMLRMKAHQQQQQQMAVAAAAAAAAAQQAQNGSAVGIGGIPMNYSQHAIIAAQQQALNAAANGAGVKQHHANGENNTSNGISSQHRPPMNIPAQGQAGSPRLHQLQHVQHHVPPSPQSISQWIQRHHPNLSPAEIQKLTEQRLNEYHMQLRQQQLSNIGVQPGATPVTTGVNGAMNAQQQQLYQQQQALRYQQHLLAQQQQQQQQRQGSPNPAQLPQSTVVGGVVSRGTTPQQNQNLLQRSASMQSVGHPLQRSQSIGQQQGHVPVQQQSPRQSQVQQAHMTGVPQQQLPQQPQAPQT